MTVTTTAWYTPLSYPTAWTTGQVVTAAQMNSLLRENMRALGDFLYLCTYSTTPITADNTFAFTNYGAPGNNNGTTSFDTTGKCFSWDASNPTRLTVNARGTVEVSFGAGIGSITGVAGSPAFQIKRNGTPQTYPQFGISAAGNHGTWSGAQGSDAFAPGPIKWFMTPGETLELFYSHGTTTTYTPSTQYTPFDNLGNPTTWLMAEFKGP